MTDDPRHVTRDGQADAIRFDPFVFVVLATTTLTNLAKTVYAAADALDDCARQHGNWRQERSNFRDSVRRSIDRLP